MNANSEAIYCLRKTGVPEEQLTRVTGGERIPLFTRETRGKAAKGEVGLAPGATNAPPQPHWDLAPIAVHVWPALHYLLQEPMHGPLPVTIDTGREYIGTASPYNSTLDITYNMKHRLFHLGDILPDEHRNEKTLAFAEYLSEQSGKEHIMPACDGGQLMFNVIISDKAVLFNGQLEGYEGLFRTIVPQPDVAVLSIVGRGN